MNDSKSSDCGWRVLIVLMLVSIFFVCCATGSMINKLCDKESATNKDLTNQVLGLSWRIDGVEADCSRRVLNIMKDLRRIKAREECQE